MNRKKIILDFGSSHIVVFERALLFYEPNIAIVKKGHNIELIAYGEEAIILARNLPESSYLVKPVEEGIIRHPEVIVLMLKRILKKVLRRKFLNKYQLYCLIPCGISLAEREAFENIVQKTGYTDVTLVESMLGLCPYTNGKATSVAILGAGGADIGVVAESKIMNGLSVNVGGDAINEKIQEFILDEYGLKISKVSAENIKREIGTLFDGDKSMLEIYGQTVMDNRWKKIEINGSQIRPALLYVYEKYCNIIESSLTILPPKELAEVSENGIVLAGGGAEMAGLVDFFIKNLRLPVYIAERPSLAHIIGLYKTLSKI